MALASVKLKRGKALTLTTFQDDTRVFLRHSWKIVNTSFPLHFSFYMFNTAWWLACNLLTTLDKIHSVLEVIIINSSIAHLTSLPPSPSLIISLIIINPHGTPKPHTISGQTKSISRCATLPSTGRSLFASAATMHPILAPVALMVTM